MSKYIESRKQKIQELSEQLNIVNQRIDSYALRLKNILSNYSNVYKLIYNNFNDIKEDSSLFYKRIAISFYHNYKHNSFCFEKKEFYFESNNLSFGIVSTLNHFIELMDQEFGLITISKDIIESESIYSKIKTIYLEIFKKHSDFTLFTDSFLQLVTKFNEQNTILDNYQDNIISISFKKNNKLEELEFLLSNKDKKLCMNFKIPSIEELFNIYEQNKNKGYVEIMQILNLFLKNEVLFLNKNLIEILNIEQENIKFRIYFSNLYIFMSNIEDFKSNLKFNININPFQKEQLKLINEKFQSIKQLENF